MPMDGDYMWVSPNTSNTKAELARMNSIGQMEKNTQRKSPRENPI
jgi:predicted transcriptional regulator